MNPYYTNSEPFKCRSNTYLLEPGFVVTVAVVALVPNGETLLTRTSHIYYENSMCISDPKWRFPTR